jgi:hypothetical protein
MVGRDLGSKTDRFDPNHVVDDDDDDDDDDGFFCSVLFTSRILTMDANHSTDM